MIEDRKTSAARKTRWEVRPKLQDVACETGSTLAEFAFVLPLLLVMIFGVVDFGRALYAYHFVSDSAREATRWASVRGFQCTDLPGACPAKPTDIKNFVVSTAPMGINVSPSTLIVDAAFVAPPGNGSMCILHNNNPGCAVQVQVSYVFKFVFPFLPKSTYTMTSKSEMIISH